jgi:hypothetical protein
MLCYGCVHSFCCLLSIYAIYHTVQKDTLFVIVVVDARVPIMTYNSRFLQPQRQPLRTTTESSMSRNNLLPTALFSTFREPPFAISLAAALEKLDRISSAPGPSLSGASFSRHETH